MCKQLSFLIILLVIILLLTSCSTPAAGPTPSPTMNMTTEPTPVVTATPSDRSRVPTATPRTEPVTLEECEAKLEAITGTDVMLQERYEKNCLCMFSDDNFYYLFWTNGKIASIINRSPNTSTETVDIETAKQITIDAVKKYDSSLFDLEVECDVEESEHAYYVTLHQVSPQFGRNTGNLADANVLINGYLDNLAIYNNEDPTIADKDYTISKEKAIEIAYEASKNKFDARIKKDPDMKVEFDDRTKHEVEIAFSVREGTAIWHTVIKFPNIPFLFGYGYIIDANTGEVLEFIGYR